MPNDGTRADYVSETEDEIIQRFGENCVLVASYQGRLAFTLMSIHAINPAISKFIIERDPTNFLYTNMVYGIGVLIYGRPNMRPIGYFCRLTFSVLGSLMFSSSCMGVFNYIRETLWARPKVATLVGFLSGRIFMVHLLAFLYHVDTRSRDRTVPRIGAFEAMYIPET